MQSQSAPDICALHCGHDAGSIVVCWRPAVAASIHQRQAKLVPSCLSANSSTYVYRHSQQSAIMHKVHTQISYNVII